MTDNTSAEALFARLHEAIGGRLFTVTVLDREAGLARRAYTSHPDTYPICGTKPMAQGDWTDMVVDRGETFVANTVAKFACYFPDHALIESLGCGSALNVPVLEGQVIGTVNVLAEAHHFTPDRIKHCQSVITAHHDELVRALTSIRP